MHKALNGTQITPELVSQYGERALKTTSVYEWMKQIKKNRTEIKHLSNTGRPITITANKFDVTIEQLMKDNQHIPSKRMAEEIELSYRSVCAMCA
jgi:hypothetical protein